jgi:hypothetical protein
VKKFRIWKLKEPDKKYQFQQLLRTKLSKDGTQSLEEEWYRFKAGFIETAEEVCGQKSGRRGYRGTPWWPDRIKESVGRNNNAWVDWFKKKEQRGKKGVEKTEQSS